MKGEHTGGSETWDCRVCGEIRELSYNDRGEVVAEIRCSCFIVPSQKIKPLDRAMSHPSFLEVLKCLKLKK